MPHIGVIELLIILAVILLLFGATRLPQLARAMGKSIHEFKQASSGQGESREPKSTAAAESSPEKPRSSSS